MNIDFGKMNGLVPAIIQDSRSLKVLMFGFMNNKAYEQTVATKKVTFYSRTKKRLWVKGESSDNFLNVKDIKLDCDHDTLLIKVQPEGPVCHTGSDTCFAETNDGSDGFLNELETIIADRKNNRVQQSYTAGLFNEGLKKIAQKVSEEATEVIIEALAGDKAHLLEESADLIFHFLVLLAYFDLHLDDVAEVLEKRHRVSYKRKM